MFTHTQAASQLQNFCKLGNYHILEILWGFLHTSKTIKIIIGYHWFQYIYSISQWFTQGRLPQCSKNIANPSYSTAVQV